MIIGGLAVSAAVGLVAVALTTGTVATLLGTDSAPTASVGGDTGPTDAPPPPAGSGSEAPGVLDTAAVSLEDNDGGVAMLTLANAAPGASEEGCITVTYHGDSDATVRLYGTTGGSGLDAYLGLTVTRGGFPSGAPAFDSCAGFVPDDADYLGAGLGVVYQGTLAAYPDSYDAGLADPPGVPAAWTDAETHAYRFAITVADDNAAQGLTASQTFVWEARGEEPPSPPGPVPVVDPAAGGPGTVVTTASGSDPCLPPGGSTDPWLRVWIAAPDTGAVLAEVGFPVAADGSWSGTITVPASAASFRTVDLHASCSATVDEVAATAATTVYYEYAPVSFTMMGTPAEPGTPARPGEQGTHAPDSPAPGTLAPPATPVSAQPTFTG